MDVLGSCKTVRMKGDELAASNDPAGQSIDYASMFALLQAWDVDGDGLVSSEDFKQGLSSIGFQISAHDADCLCKALDTDVKTLIGGAPVTEEFAKEIGADAYAYDAANAVEVTKRLSDTP